MNYQLELSKHLAKQAVRNWAFAAVFFCLLLAVLSFMALNVPTTFDQVKGTVVRLGTSDSQYAIGTKAFIELPDGRVVPVFYPAGTVVPAPGSETAVTRGRRRFFGEVFEP